MYGSTAKHVSKFKKSLPLLYSYTYTDFKLTKFIVNEYLPNGNQTEMRRPGAGEFSQWGNVKWGVGGGRGRVNLF